MADEPGFSEQPGQLPETDRLIVSLLALPRMFVIVTKYRPALLIVMFLIVKISFVAEGIAEPSKNHW